MKKLLQRVFGVTASAVLLLTSALPSALAVDPSSHHAHHADDDVIPKPEKGFTITLKLPSTYEVGTENPSFGAYQIFTGTVKNDGTSYTNPGNTHEQIPLTDIKWGNAFGDINAEAGADGKTGKEIWQENIVNFVLALASPPTEGEYAAAFTDFDDFKDFKSGDYLADKFYTDPTGENLLDTEKVPENVKFDKLATEVADVIEEHGTLEWLQAFTDVLGGYGMDYSTSGTHKGYVTRCYDDVHNTSPVPGSYTAPNKEEGTEGTYKITVPEGYYMVLDRSDLGADSGHEGDTNESYSARMLFVANNITQQIKQDVPSLTKTISRDGDYYETEAAGVGDEVNFRLTGQLPSNYDQYTLGYQFTFTDELSKGLTLKGTEETEFTDKTPVEYTDASLVITAQGLYKEDSSGKTWDSNAEQKILIGSHKEMAHTKHDDVNYAYSATVTKDEDTGKQTLVVNFPCLKEIVITDDSTTYTLGVTDTEKSEIRVDYVAVVDEDAVVSPAGTAPEDLNGNTNKAILTYSDNPQNYSDTDDTTEEHATVYTFGMDIIKVDAAEYLKTGTATGTAVLEGAKFAVVRPDADTLDEDGKTKETTTWEIAKFQLIDKDTAMNTTQLPIRFYYGYYSVLSWETIKDAEKTAVKGAEFDEKWLENYIDEENATEVYNITSLSDGVLNISGLDSNVTYTIAETESPTDDYVKINPFEIVLFAADDDDDEYTGKLESAIVSNTIGGGESFSYDKFVQLVDPPSMSTAYSPTGVKDTDGSANMIVANFKYIDLPSTGGVGTYWFYILGAGGLAISFVLFRLSRKKIVQ